jgi:hypothetical protein
MCACFARPIALLAVLSAPRPTWASERVDPATRAACFIQAFETLRTVDAFEQRGQVHVGVEAWEVQALPCRRDSILLRSAVPAPARPWISFADTASVTRCRTRPQASRRTGRWSAATAHEPTRFPAFRAAEIGSLVIAMMLSPMPHKRRQSRTHAGHPQKRLGSPIAGFLVIVRPLSARRSRRTAARRVLWLRIALCCATSEESREPNLRRSPGDELPRMRDVGCILRFTLER